jgi:hypothetical protein
LSENAKRVLTPRLRSRSKQLDPSMEPTRRFRRGLRRYDRSQLFGGHAPASLFAHLFTSSPGGASAHRDTATMWLDGLTDRARGPPIGFPSPSDPWS